MDTPKLKLISHVLCPYVQRVRITLHEKNIAHEIEFIDLSDPPEWFKDISPLGKVPVLLVDDEVLFESNVIIEYLDEISPGSLHPHNALSKAKNRAWMEFGSEILDTIAGLYNAKDKITFEEKLTSLEQKFKSIEAILADGPYFNQKMFSMVDAVFGPVFRYFDVIDKITDVRIFSAAPKVRAWRNALQKRPSVQQAVVSDYPQLLLKFFKQRNSYLTELIHQQSAAG
ncbi:MAG: glutathione S-transferase family protein [Gammaproteobacteria bacterium]|nr:glutathione S-transferase family protein [Gammaproteobacteria bacterium]